MTRTIFVQTKHCQLNIMHRLRRNLNANKVFLCVEQASGQKIARYDITLMMMTMKNEILTKNAHEKVATNDGIHQDNFISAWRTRKIIMTTHLNVGRYFYDWERRNFEQLIYKVWQTPIATLFDGN